MTIMIFTFDRDPVCRNIAIDIGYFVYFTETNFINCICERNVVIGPEKKRYLLPNLSF